MKPSWPVKKIGDLFDVQLGKMLNEKAKQGDLSPYLANFNVRWGSFDLSRLNKMAFSEKEQRKFSLRPGDLLMCEGGEIGRCAVWQGSDNHIFYQKALHRLRPLESNVKPEFIYYYMQYIASKGELPKLVGETSIAHLTREKLLCLRVPAPPLPEQTAIADLLSTWDMAIEKTKRLIAAKMKRFSAVTQQLLHSRTVGQREVHLYDICQPITRKNDLGELNVLTTSAQHGLVSQLDYYHKSVSAEDVSGYYLLKHGEFAYNRSSSSGYPYGAIKRLEDHSQGVLSTLYLCFSLKKDAPCDSDFLAHALESGVLNRQLASVCQEGARSHGLLNITKADFFGLKILLPDVSEQQRIAATLDTARQEIDLLKRQAEAYRKQKRGLMQKLLTGQWRVKVDTDRHGRDTDLHEGENV